MAIQLNEEIRDEARKMSEFIVEDTKRTVEMLGWLKSKNTDSAPLTDAITKGATVIIDKIMPRLRDRLAAEREPEIKLHTVGLEALEKINLASDKLCELRGMLSGRELNASDLDDLAYDAMKLLAEASELL